MNFTYFTCYFALFCLLLTCIKLRLTNKYLSIKVQVRISKSKSHKSEVSGSRQWHRCSLGCQNSDLHPDPVGSGCPVKKLDEKQ